MLCPSCLAPYPANSYKTEFSQLVGRRGKVETWRTTSLNIPICDSCHRKAFRTSKYLKWALILGVVLGIPGFALVYQAAGTGPAGSITPVIVFMVVMILWLVLATAHLVFLPILPIRMVSPAEFEFRNSQYAELFRKSNQTSLSGVRRRHVRPRTVGLVLAGLFGASAVGMGVVGLVLGLGGGLDYIFVALYGLAVGAATLGGVVAVIKGHHWWGRRMMYAAGVWGLPIGLLGAVGIVGAALSLNVSYEESQELPPPPPGRNP